MRIVHVGLGNFHRAHQAWYTNRCEDASRWGIAAFTGRSARAARVLAEQDGLYTLIERAEDEDRATVIGSISEAFDGADLSRFVALLAARETSVVTLTVTEAGYRLDGDGLPDRADAAVVADREALRAAVRDRDRSTAPVTALGRLLLGLAHRRSAGGHPIAVVPCDNIAANGALIRRALLALAADVDPALSAWVESTVSFVSTSVDRITPRTTDADLGSAARLTGYTDLAPVVTEPFSDWVLCGEFPAGRPAWETAGASLVADIDAFEQRKLWLLNGAHSLLAYLGTLRGHGTVAAAIADPVCRDATASLWQEAGRALPPEVDADRYCRSLLARFVNSRIEHRLDQIGMDGVSKLPVRVVPVALAERRAGRPAGACATVIAAWARLAAQGRLPADSKAAAIRQALAGATPEDSPRPDVVTNLVALVSGELAADGDFVALVRTRLREFGTGS